MRNLIHNLDVNEMVVVKAVLIEQNIYWTIKWRLQSIVKTGIVCEIILYN